MTELIKTSDGYLKVIYGPMFSGKTTFLLGKLNLYADIGISTMYINTVLDTRADEPFSSHNTTIKMNSGIFGIKTKRLMDVYEKTKDFRVIGIDESQFFEDLIPFVTRLVEDDQKIVFAAGLGTDFLRQPFGKILDLIKDADEVEKLHSICSLCLKNKQKISIAHFSKRLIASEETIVIGGKDTYVPVCRKCYKD